MRTKRLKKRGGMFSVRSSRSNKPPTQENTVDVKITKARLFTIIKKLSEEYRENPELYFDIIAQKLEGNSKNISDVVNFLMMDMERVLTFIDKLNKIEIKHKLRLKECDSIRNLRPGYLSEPFVALTLDSIADKIKSREKKSRENNGKLTEDTKKEKLTENQLKTQDKWFKFLDDERNDCRENAIIYYDKTLKKKYSSFYQNDNILPLFISSNKAVFDELITIYEDFSLKPSEYVQFKEYIYSNEPIFLGDKLMLQFIENSDSKEELKELVDSHENNEYIDEFNNLFDKFTSDSHDSPSKSVDTLAPGLEELKLGGFKKRTFKNKYNI
jgi:hypothetical protein